MAPQWVHPEKMEKKLVGKVQNWHVAVIVNGQM